MKKIVNVISLLCIMLVSVSLEAAPRDMGTHNISKIKAARRARAVLARLSSESRLGGAQLGDPAYPVGVVEQELDPQDVMQRLYNLSQRILALEEELRLLKHNKR